MWTAELCRRVGRTRRAAFAAVLLAAIAVSAGVAIAPARAASGIEIAAPLSLTGDGYTFGQGALQGEQMAVDEANERGGGPHVTLTSYDDKSSDDEAKAVAERVAASRAIVALGPAFSTASLAAGPVYAAAGLASLPPTATADSINQNATTFRVVFKNSDQGATLANYVSRVLGSRRADVVVVDTEYGRSLRGGFESAAGPLAITAQYFVFKEQSEEDGIARAVAADPAHPPVIFLTLDPEGARLLASLRRMGVTGPFLGGDAFGDESFSARLRDEPEEKQQQGFFTDNLYGLSPVILDSAGADVLDFAARFRARFGNDPVWFSVAGYDAARAALTAARAAAAAGVDVKAQRAAALQQLLSQSSVERATPGLLGPLWFDSAHARQQAIRVGRFHLGRYESAPLQIVPVSSPDSAQEKSGAAFQTDAGRWARLQRVVYTGIFINEVSNLDLSRSSFSADFYLWLRFARDAGPASADPTDISFPNQISGSFDRAHPSEERSLDDGTEYRLWRVQGEFRNDFDLHRYPFDHQELSLPFFHTRVDKDQIVYVVDQRASALPGVVASSGKLSAVSTSAFRNLSQWDALNAVSRRENLVTPSSLGDPTRVGVESGRELSGFIVTVDVQRKALTTLSKTLIPLVLLTLIMYVSLFMPARMVDEKIAIAITGALSGAVLLTAIDTQLGGNFGYTIGVEYVFYGFFALSLLCILSVVGAERLREAGRPATARLADHTTKLTFLAAVLGTTGALVISSL